MLNPLQPMRKRVSPQPHFSWLAKNKHLQSKPEKEHPCDTLYKIERERGRERVRLDEGESLESWETDGFWRDLAESEGFGWTRDKWVIKVAAMFLVLSESSRMWKEQFGFTVSRRIRVGMIQVVRNLFIYRIILFSLFSVEVHKWKCVV